MADFTQYGSTPVAAIFKSESHKLHHAFPLKTGKSVVQGQLVVLNADGTVQGFGTDDSLANVIGVAITNSANPSYQASMQHGPVDITVAVKGHAIVNAVAGDDGITAGPVKPTGALDSTGKYAKYINTEAATTIDVDIDGGTDTGQALASVDDQVVAIALNPGDDGEPLHVLIL